MGKREETFAEMCERLKREKVPELRTADTLEVRKYFLIVSEGIRTEPIYFQYFKNVLPKNLLETIEIEGAGAETIRVVEFAIKKRAERLRNILLPPYDEVWAVFDKDDFPDENFNGAIEMAIREGIEYAASNEAFELWYLLQFQYLDTAIKRQQYFVILSKILSFPYEKNNPKVVEYIFQNGNFRRAIEWAKKTRSHACWENAIGSLPSHTRTRFSKTSGIVSKSSLRQ